MTDQSGSSGAAKQLTRQGRLRRESLLDAAEHMLVEVGDAESSLRDIANRAGVRLGHLQHYFPTRGELIHAMLKRVLDRSLRRLAGAATQGRGEDEPAADVMTVSPEQLVAVLLAEQDDPFLTRLYVEIWAIAARDESVAEVAREFYQRYVGLVSEFISRRRPDLPAQRCWGRARAFVGLLEGNAVMRSEITGTDSPAADDELTAIAIRVLTETD